MENVKVNPVEFGLEVKQAENITNGLKVTLAERVALIDTYEDVINMEITEGNLKTFKELRLLIVKNRTQGLTKWKTTEKAFYLAGGNFVQAIYNKEVAINEAMELKLSNAEKHFENLEKKRLEDLQFERLKKIHKYVEDANLIDLSIMDEDVFEAYLSTKKANFELIEKERLAENKRIEDARLKEVARLKAIEVENAILKKEADLKTKQLEEERLAREKKESTRVAKENKERLARQELERKEKEKQDAILLKAENERKRLELELKTKQEHEAKIEKERLETIEKERLKELEKSKAPLKDKLNTWIDSMSLGKPPVLNETITDIEVKFEAFKQWAKKEVNNI